MSNPCLLTFNHYIQKFIVLGQGHVGDAFRYNLLQEVGECLDSVFQWHLLQMELAVEHCRVAGSLGARLTPTSL